MGKERSGKWKKRLLKALYVQIAFLILHYSYDLFPCDLLKVFSGTSEAVFEHMKIAFYSYGVVSLIEFLVNRKKVEDSVNYGFSRLGGTVLYCWPMFVLFFTPPAIFGKYPNDFYEILSANIVLYLTSIIVIIIESQFEKVKQSKEFRWAIGLLFVFLVHLFTTYSFQSPWFDVFAIPPGWE